MFMSLGDGHHKIWPMTGSFLKNPLLLATHSTKTRCKCGSQRLWLPRDKCHTRLRCTEVKRRPSLSVRSPALGWECVSCRVRADLGDGPASSDAIHSVVVSRVCFLTFSDEPFEFLDGLVPFLLPAHISTLYHPSVWTDPRTAPSLTSRWSPAPLPPPACSF